MDEELLHCLNGEYGALIGTLRANRNAELVDFRDTTYGLLTSLSLMEVSASDTAITLQYQVPDATPAQPFATRVHLDHRSRQGYDVMATINPYLGNPVTRIYLRASEEASGR
jgi:hypothetical protein